jgi:hypothetical protein
MAELFDHFDETRTCPVCNSTLKCYAKYDVRVLACLSCPWATANDTVGSAGVLLRELAQDREVHAQLERAFEKGGAR